MFRLEKYLATMELVQEDIFEDSVMVFKSKLDNEYLQRESKVPVKFREINDVFGRCFYLYTSEYATVEQKFQGCFSYHLQHTKKVFSGWTIELPSDVDWRVFLAPGQLYAPTHSDTVSLESFTLQQNTKNYMTFEAEKYEFLKKRGWFDSKKYCKDDIEFTDTVACEKKCMLNNLKVKENGVTGQLLEETLFLLSQIECQPSDVNVFDGLDLPTCSSEEEVDVFRNLISNSLFPNSNCEECLSPCKYFKYKFRVENIL